MATRWIERAKRYYGLAVEMLERGLYPEACFFAQQAVEFFLKGIAVDRTGARPYTYSILALLRALGIDAGGEAFRCAKFLTEQYIASRYPDARMLEYDRDDGEECVKCMELLFRYVSV